MIAVLVPVLDRPDRAEPLIESILAASTLVDEVLFLCSPGDEDQIEACMNTGPEANWLIVPFALAGGDYARKINYGITVTRSPWVLQAADDLRFHPGWDEEALARDTGPHVGVIGTNDMGNPMVRSGRHATHSLIRRAYVEEQGTIDELGKALHEGYHHCWVDNELVETAQARNAWSSARRSRVEHLHHIWPVRRGSRERKGVDDATYRRGQTRYREDNKLFHTRRPLWRRPLVAA
jgi:glycosyltransferase involved in cell wall biosynthesis